MQFDPRHLLRDAQFALRGFRKNPAFAAIAIFTLAVGIGANTAIFSVANALLLRQLPFPNPDRLALISSARPADGLQQGPLSWLRFQLVRDHKQSVSVIAAFTPVLFILAGAAQEQLNSSRVSAKLFQIL